MTLTTKAILLVTIFAGGCGAALRGKPTPPPNQPAASEVRPGDRGSPAPAMPPVTRELDPDNTESRFGFEEARQRRLARERQERERRARLGVVEGPGQATPPPAPGPRD